MKKILFSMLAALSFTPLFAQNNFLFKDPPRTILENLKRGNARFIAGRLSHPHTNEDRRNLAAEKPQRLYAIGTVLSCSDSRVPVELIFDVGIMDIFVLRVPGNVCNKNEVGGIEYGVMHAQTPLVVVMGHTDCGAIAAAMAEKPAKLEPNILELLKPISGVARRVREQNPHLQEKALVDLCIRENVFEAIKDLFTYSKDVLKEARQGNILVVGAVYDVKTGKVEWLENRRVRDIMKSLPEPPPKK